MTEVHKQVVTCRSEEKLRAARAALGAAAVHLVRVNSGRGDPASVLGYGGAWREGTLPGTLPQGGAGEPPSRPPTPAAVLTWANFPPLTAPHPGGARAQRIPPLCQPHCAVSAWTPAEIRPEQPYIADHVVSTSGWGRPGHHNAHILDGEATASSG